MMKVICFHNPNEANGFLSNWYMSSFTDEEGMTYSSMEQYMMYRKARLFGDIETAEEIMAEKDPAKIKELGRGVSRFIGDVWDMSKYEIVKKGVMLKFSRNDKLKAQLLAFGKDCIFAECAVSDKIWGIGLSMIDPDRLNKEKWRGKNLLGQAITEVRDLLLNEV